MTPSGESSGERPKWLSLILDARMERDASEQLLKRYVTAGVRDGLPLRQIASAAGVSHETARRWAKNWSPW
jgi:transposase-like protein